MSDSIGDERKVAAVVIERSVRASSILVAGLWFAIGSTVVAAHDPGTGGAAHGPAVPFLVAIGLSIALSSTAGFAAVWTYRSTTGLYRDLGSPMRLEVTMLLVGLGLVALYSAMSSQPFTAIGAGLLGGTLALLGRDRGIVSHHGCADIAFGAILVHRTVEGALVVSIYSVNAALGLVGVALLTVHAVAETIAIGGLYAPVGRRWGVASVVAVQLGFLVGALFGGLLVGLLTPTSSTAALAAVGGILVVAGAIEIRGAVLGRWKRLGA